MVIQKERIIVKRNEALIRTKKYNGLTLNERLELICSRRGKSKKETNKILKQIKEIENNDKDI